MKFVIAQLFGVLANLCLIGASQTKKKVVYLTYNIVSYILFMVNLGLLGAYSGVVNSVCPLVLTIICAKDEKVKLPKWVIMIFCTAVSIGGVLTYTNIYSLLPTIASFVYIMITISNEMEKVRALTVISRLLWAIYDFMVMSYLTFFFDIVLWISAIVAVIAYDYLPRRRARVMMQTDP